MAPTILAHTPSAEHVRHLSRSVSSLLPRSSTDGSSAPLASVFALILRQTLGISSRAAALPVSRSLKPETRVGTLVPPLSSSLYKRQNYILAIPTTYEGLNDGPAPGAVVGITLGAIGGFVLVLFLVLTVFRFYGGGRVVEEEIITTHRHEQSSRRKSRSRSRSQAMSEAPRRQSRRETVVVEETVRRETVRDPSVVVEEDDIVEVIEEHSPERGPSRRESKRTSGFRTVDPAELGGGGRPMRKVSRR